MKKHKRELSKTIFTFLTLNLLVLITLTLIYDLFNMDFSIPLSYFGGDDYAYYVNAKMIEQTGWITDFSRLGAPYGSDYRDFSSVTLFNFDNLGLKAFVTLCGDWVIAVNCYYFFIYFMIANICCFVLKKLGISNIWSVVMSILYAFSPYIFMRGISHMVLSAYQFIPLSFLICFWIYEDDKLFSFKNIFYKKNIFVLIMLLLIANNGIGYYAFFLCFFFCVTGLLKLLKGRGIKYMFKAFAACGICVFFLVLNMIPSIIYGYQNGKVGNFERSFADSEIYGLKIIQLLLPSTGHLEIIRQIYSKYVSEAPLINENSSAFLGYVGAIGFIILVLMIFVGDKFKKNERIQFVSELNMWAVLLGIIGGGSTIFSFFISTQIRSYNRISIFILFLSLFGISILLNQLKDKRKIVLSIIILGIGLYMQIPENINNSEVNRESFESDRDFVEQIEANVEKGAMIYQMPYHAYPEAGNLNNMGDYALFNGYLFSEELEWSYGASRGRKTDNWQQKIINLPLKKQVKKIKEKGFSGIYIDLRAYDDEQKQNLLSKMDQFFSTSNKIESSNGNLVFYQYTE